LGGKGAVAELKPDGRSPRVKSNIKALLSSKGRTSPFKTKVPILREEAAKEVEEEDLKEETREGRNRAGSGRAINLDLVKI